MSETTTEVECPRCGKSGKIQIPEENISERAFAKCPECGLVYNDSYFDIDELNRDIERMIEESKDFNRRTTIALVVCFMVAFLLTSIGTILGGCVVFT